MHSTKPTIKPLIIVGIDPGTTTAYALLDTKGELLSAGSSKEFDISALIITVIDKGLPLIVGCDKKKAPGFVDGFATKVGAKLVSPEDDLKVDEKQEMTRRFKENVNNTHEMDALASALFAYRKYKALLDKIENLLRRENKLDMIHEVTKLVFSTEEGLPIRVALDILERPDAEEVKAVKELLDAKKRSTKMSTDTSVDYVQYLKLYENMCAKVASLESENIRLKGFCRTQKHEMELLRHEFNRMIKEIKKRQEKNSDETLMQKLRSKDSSLNQIKREIDAMKESSLESNARLQRKINVLNSIISSPERYAIIRKIENLGEAYSRWNDKNIEGIKHDDLLFVKDASVCNENNAKELKTRYNVQTIITEKPNKTISQHFRVIVREKIKDITYKETDEFLFLDRKEFDAFLKKNFVFERILKEYKEERNI